jgi:hypothetical protein
MQQAFLQGYLSKEAAPRASAMETLSPSNLAKLLGTLGAVGGGAAGGLLGAGTGAAASQINLTEEQKKQRKSRAVKMALLGALSGTVGGAAIGGVGGALAGGTGGIALMPLAALGDSYEEAKRNSTAGGATLAK